MYKNSRLKNSYHKDDDSPVENEEDQSKNTKNSQDDQDVIMASRSRMNDFISDFLEKTRLAEEDNGEEEEETNDTTSAKIEDAALEDITLATHLIAIPMETACDLMIELESVQRAVLYHCPILLDACIQPAATRMPLLYVQARNPSTQVTSTLAQIVKRLVNRHMFKKEEIPTDFDFQKDNRGINPDGFRPLSMTFKTLEIDGENNSRLSTVGTVDSEEDDIVLENDNRLNNFIRDLQASIAANGWKIGVSSRSEQQGNQRFGGDVVG